MAQYTGDRKTIGEVLSLASPLIDVPEWQRNYSWRPTEVEAFWTDLIAFSEEYPEDNVADKEYFLGSLVIVDRGTRYQILDGQQRLATATILLSVIRDFLSQYQLDAATSLSHKYIFEHDYAANKKSYKLTMSQYDREFFRREIQEPRDGDWTTPAPTLHSHSLIRDARTYFTGRFKNTYDAIGDGEAAFKWSLRLQRILTDHVSVVAVISPDENNAATVFETLNDRGIGLSTSDLLRTLMLRRANQQDREEINAHWETILQLEDRVDEFIRHYWLSHYGDVKTRGLYKEMKRSLEARNANSLLFSRSLQSDADVYRDVVAARDSDETVSGLLRDISQLGAKVLYPAILSSFATLSSGQKSSLLRALIALFVRHNVIGNLEGTRFETFAYTLARELRGASDEQTALERIRQFAPGNDEFRARFSTALVRRQATARYLLTELERAQSTGETEVAGPSKVHVEHIYPQSPAAGAKLDQHESLVHRLGNLTLLARPLNQSIKNAPFGEKKKAYESSELKLTRGLLGYAEWNEETIDVRQQKMSELAPSIWVP